MPSLLVVMISSMTSPSSRLDWHKLVAGPHRSARASDPSGGYYAIHKSGGDSITTYHMHPFYRIGIYPTVKTAIAVCEWHNEVYNNGGI